MYQDMYAGIDNIHDQLEDFSNVLGFTDIAERTMYAPVKSTGFAPLTATLRPFIEKKLSKVAFYPISTYSLRKSSGKMNFVPHFASPRPPKNSIVKGDIVAIFNSGQYAGVYDVLGTWIDANGNIGALYLFNPSIRTDKKDLKDMQNVRMYVLTKDKSSMPQLIDSPVRLKQVVTARKYLPVSSDVSTVVSSLMPKSAFYNIDRIALRKSDGTKNFVPHLLNRPPKNSIQAGDMIYIKKDGQYKGVYDVLNVWLDANGNIGALYLNNPSVADNVPENYDLKGSIFYVLTKDRSTMPQDEKPTPPPPKPLPKPKPNGTKGAGVKENGEAENGATENGAAQSGETSEQKGVAVSVDRKILGMKKSVAIPVMIGGGLVLAAGVFFAIKKFRGNKSNK